ncbi:hypothetical protein ANN_27021 [Periplaneta americana]|uniref:Uncharacterized protein n=1 Tax=Periplaneta americana TaxID=6978 RepID=A0ABQ8RX60_PERAM|nr:hypothetical protein ANN_27021 [Periplaneta americana]
MAGLCEGGIEPPGSLKARHGRVQHPVKKSYKINQMQVEGMVSRYQQYKDRGEIDIYLRTLSYRLKFHAVPEDESKD